MADAVSVVRDVTQIAAIGPVCSTKSLAEHRQEQKIFFAAGSQS
jgi:hypothetical protein